MQVSTPQFRANSWLKKVIRAHRGSGRVTLDFCASVRGRLHGESVGLRRRRVKRKVRRMNLQNTNVRRSFPRSFTRSFTHSFTRSFNLFGPLLQNHLNK